MLSWWTNFWTMITFRYFTTFGSTFILKFKSTSLFSPIKMKRANAPHKWKQWHPYSILMWQNNMYNRKLICLWFTQGNTSSTHCYKTGISVSKVAWLWVACEHLCVERWTNLVDEHGLCVSSNLLTFDKVTASCLFKSCTGLIGFLLSID